MRTLRAGTPWLFLILALVSSLYLAWRTPPFLAADELTHFQRSDMLTFGPAGSGHAPATGLRTGRVDVSIAEASRPLEHVRGRPEAKVRDADLAAANAKRFDGRTQDIYQVNARNPLFYLPAGAAVLTGKLLDRTVVETLLLARAANALAAALLGFFALRLARQAQLPLFAILTLPMTAALFGSVNQDAQIVGCVALAVAVLSRAIGEARPLRSWECWGLAALFAAVAMAKPPYAALSLLMWLAPAERRGVKWAAALAALAVAAAWNLWLAHDGWTPPDRAGAPLDPGTQLRFLIEHPRAGVAIGLATLQAEGGEYLRQFIGVLGWLDTHLPAPFYPAAGVAIGLACAVVAAPFEARDEWRWARLAAPLVAAAGAAGVLAAMYVTWTKVGGATIDGVQGRYFLPLALAATLALEGKGSWLDAGRRRRGLQAAVTAAVLAFPVAGFLATAQAMAERF